MNNSAVLKALANHFTKNAASHMAQAACHTGLSQCMKSLGLDFAKGDKNDFHSELASQHTADAERCEKIAAFCNKCANAKADEGDMAKMVAAIIPSVTEYIDKKFGDQVVPSLVKGVFLTEDPSAGRLVPRAGGPTPPTPTESVPIGLRDMIQE
jgi:hypothetical protein